MTLLRWSRVNRRAGAPQSIGHDDEPTKEETKRGYLTKQAVFRDLLPDDIEEIVNRTRMMTTPKGKIFFVPGESGEVLYLLKKGKVELYRLTPEGRKLVVDIIDPGTFFGEMACIGQGMQDSYAEVTEDALICVMSRRDIQNLMLEKPIVALRILEFIGQRLVEVTTRLEESAFLGAEERVASLLLRLSVPHDGRLLVDGHTHQDLADMLGLYRETVTHALDHLKARGLIAMERKRIELLQPEPIRALAHQDETTESLAPGQ